MRLRKEQITMVKPRRKSFQETQKKTIESLVHVVPMFSADRDEFLHLLFLTPTRFKALFITRKHHILFTSLIKTTMKMVS